MEEVKPEMILSAIDTLVRQEPNDMELGGKVRALFNSIKIVNEADS
jgi:hypothetical protein